MVLASLAVVTVNTFYHHLLINIRFFLKTKNVTCGLFFFDCLNYLCCYCVLRFCCKENCQKRPVVATIKWLFIVVIAVVTFAMVEERALEREAQFEVGMIMAGKTNFHIYIMLYALQQVIWPIFHTVIWVFFACFTCCVPFWRESYEEPERRDFKNRIWNYEYVEYELG
mmetsp:Transcript_40993/g.53712  ORF Transcript_40993/g.53712 Transcript_40993/m.53712 type:complete len:169 (-) Transcript_40993:695-1201(-)